MRLATPSVSLDLLSDENGPLFSALEESTDRCCREGSGPAVVDMTRQLQARGYRARCARQATHPAAEVLPDCQTAQSRTAVLRRNKRTTEQVLACVYQTVFKHEAKELAEAQEVEKRIPVEMLGMARKRLQGGRASPGRPPQHAGGCASSYLFTR